MYNKELNDLQEVYDALVKLLPKEGQPENYRECPALVQFYRAKEIEEDIFTNRLEDPDKSSTCNAVFGVAPYELGWEHINDCEYNRDEEDGDEPLQLDFEMGVGYNYWGEGDFGGGCDQEYWDGCIPGKNPDYKRISKLLAPKMRQIMEEAAKEQSINFPDASKNR